MRGSEYAKADDEARAQRYMRDAICYRFKAGESMQQIAETYELTLWVVEAIIRDAL